MAGRRRWFKVSIRFGLLSISLLAVLLSVHQYFQSAGERRSKAVDVLSQLGVTAFHARNEVEFQDFKFTGTHSGIAGETASSMRLMLPRVIQNPPSRLVKFVSRFLGDEILDDYGSLLVYKSISHDPEMFLKTIDELPNIESIHFYKNTIEDALIQRLKSERPGIVLKELEVEAPKDESGNPAFVKL